MSDVLNLVLSDEPKVTLGLRVQLDLVSAGAIAHGNIETLYHKQPTRIFGRNWELHNGSLVGTKLT